MEEPPIKVFIVDDDEDIRTSLACLLSSECEVVGVAASAEETLQSGTVASADVLLTDLTMPGMNGIELVQLCRQRWPGLRSLILSANDALQKVQQAVKAGASGYLLKGNPEEILPAIKAAYAGMQVLSHRLRYRREAPNF